MKIKYQTTRETALILREMSGNCGSSLPTLRGVGGFCAQLVTNRERSIESVMAGEVDLSEATPEAVVRSFETGRRFRRKTVARLASTIILSA